MKKINLKNNKLGAFLVPTGIGASIGGYAGDASAWDRKFAQEATIIVNPNVVNAGVFSGITDDMLYVEGYSIDEFFKGNICLEPSIHNKLGVVFDKSISQDVLNIHINTINAVKTVYDLDIVGYEITDEEVGVDFFIDSSKISTGRVKNVSTLLPAAQKLIDRGAEAIAIVCRFDNNENDSENEDYANGIGVDPIGGVEAIISHYVSRELKIPAAHAPAFADFSITTELVNPKASAEYITPTFLPCVLLGLNNAPKIIDSRSLRGTDLQHTQGASTEAISCKLDCKQILSVSDLDFLVMPYNSLGSIPVFEAIKRGIKVFAVKENTTVLNVTNDLLLMKSGIVLVENYQDCLELIKKDEKEYK